MRPIALSPLLIALLFAPALAQPVIEVTPPPPTPKPSGQVITIGEDVSRPDTSGRVVKVFDFEEAKTNPGEVPQNWFRGYDRPEHHRPGFPAWNKATLSYVTEGGVAFAGNGSVKLPTQGGSTSLLVGEGVLPVFQNADYLLSAKVRTEHLVNARAALAARFLDKSGIPIAASEVRTPLTLTAGDWQTITVELVGEFEQATDIQLELQLLQPEQYTPAAAAGTHRIWAQDISGAAWFDDVAVVQLPRVELSTTAPNNIVAAPDQPELKMLVRDLTGESLAIKLEVLDSTGQPADRLSKKIGAGFTSTTWKPKLTRLGWYRATLEITTEAGARVGRSYCDFIWVPGLQPAAEFGADHHAAADRVRLGLIIDDLPQAMLPRLPDLVRSIGAGAVTLPVWADDTTLDNVVPRTEALRPVIDALYSDRQQVTLSLPRIPTYLAEQVQIEEADPWTLLIGDPKRWIPFTAPMLERFGQRVNHWQVGRIGDDRAYWRKDAPKELATITESLSHLVPGPVVTIPMLAGRKWHFAPRPAGGLPPALVEAVTPDTTAQAVGLEAKAWAQGGAKDGAEMCMAFQPFAPSRYGTTAGAIETAKRAVEFWAACSADSHDIGTLTPGATIALEQPWDWTKARRPQLMPRPELAVWRNLLDRLAGRRVVGTLPVADGAICYILAPAPGAPADRGGALVAWNESAQPQDAVLAADLGDGPVQLVDIFGNPSHPTTAQRSGSTTRPLTRIQLTPTPIFVEGVDVPLVRFVAAFAVDPPYLESSNDQHERDIVITNPWPTGITGRFTILEPGGFESGQQDRTWRISPRAARFSVPAGQTDRIPIKLSFSPIEEVGTKDFVVAVELSADKPYGSVEIRRTVEVGVRTIALELTSATQGENGKDLVVEAMISNTGPHPLTLEITAFAEGSARSKASVTDLTPGNQTVKRFVYPGAAATMRGQRVILSVFDPDTKMRVNKSILIK